MSTEHITRCDFCHEVVRPYTGAHLELHKHEVGGTVPFGYTANLMFDLCHDCFIELGRSLEAQSWEVKAL
jgi:hypothetical protein